MDPTAVLTGDVTLGEKTSVWANVTIRADIDSVSVDDDSNIQDNSCLHVDWGDPLKIGKRVVVGHSCTVHGCEIGDDCLIGMGSTILSGAKIGDGCLLAAGSLVLEGQEIPAGSVAMGSPAKVRREISDAERERIRQNAERYVELSREYIEAGLGESDDAGN